MSLSISKKFSLRLAIILSVLTLSIVATNISHGGDDKKPKEKTPVALDLKKGKKVYETTCFACHGKDGKGPIPGVPDMTGKDTRLKQKNELLLKHVIEGYQSPGSPLAMPPKGGNPQLSEQDLHNAIGYMKDKFLPKKK